MSYRLVCSACGLTFEDDGICLTCPREHAPSLLITDYSFTAFECDEKVEGMYRYSRWLPDANRLPRAPGSIMCQSPHLSSILQLPKLWIAFSGYSPERGAMLETATFKELEVYGVLSRFPRQAFRALVVASAGNTGAAFAKICSDNNVKCLVIVPESGLQKMLFAERLKPSVKIVSLKRPSSYSDAISLADSVAAEGRFVPEGGVRNVARRDGMGTVMLNAVETMRCLPDYYFQAIGSGSGAIAAHEAAKRLIRDSRFGLTFPRLMLSQNAPFTPVYDSWQKRQRNLVEIDIEVGRTLTEQTVATVLSNPRPPYAVAGGIFDVLSQSHGDVFAIQNDEVLAAIRLFESCEGIDLEPAAGVALASLMKAVSSGQIHPGATVLLHLTGGASKRAPQTTKYLARPNLEISLGEINADTVVEKVRRLFNHSE